MKYLVALLTVAGPMLYADPGIMIEIDIFIDRPGGISSEPIMGDRD